MERVRNLSNPVHINVVRNVVETYRHMPNLPGPDDRSALPLIRNKICAGDCSHLQQ